MNVMNFYKLVYINFATIAILCLFHLKRLVDRLVTNRQHKSHPHDQVDLDLTF